MALVALVPVALLMRRQVRRGAWDHVDASRPDERPILFVVGIVAVVALSVVGVVLGRESFLARGAIGVAAMLAICAATTRWIKVSLHLAFAALAATVLLAIGSPFGWPLLAVLPALAWSRLVLGRHRPVEIALGTLIGAIAGAGIAFL